MLRPGRAPVSKSDPFVLLGLVLKDPGSNYEAPIGLWVRGG